MFRLRNSRPPLRTAEDQRRLSWIGLPLIVVVAAPVLHTAFGLSFWVGFSVQLAGLVAEACIVIPVLRRERRRSRL